MDERNMDDTWEDNELTDDDPLNRSSWIDYTIVTLLVVGILLFFTILALRFHKAIQ